MQLFSDHQLRAVAHSLQLQRQELLAQLRQRLHQADEEQQLALLNSYTADAEQALASQLGDTDLALLRHELQELRDIDAALASIADGGYGQCEQCGMPIAHARLKVQPSARKCVHCQAASERQQSAAH